MGSMMPVQPIFRGLDSYVLVGYQARGRGQFGSRYFSLGRYGNDALRLANLASAALEAGAPLRKVQRNNTSGINGLRVLWVPSRSPEGMPRQIVQASGWDRMGHPRSTGYSVEKHGWLGAVRLAIAARERWTGEPFALTAKQALRRLRR